MDRYFIGNYYISDGCKPLSTKVKMPIEWLALEERDGKSLLLSKDVLDWEMYGDRGETSWFESYMYEHLRELYQLFFSSEEKKIIVKNKLGPLFLLSKEEIVKYLPTEEMRRAIMLDVYKNDNGEIETSMEHYTYWLRDDVASDCTNVPMFTSLGDFETRDSEADEIGVRVAMWVDTKQARILTAKKGYNRWHHWWDFSEF